MGWWRKISQWCLMCWRECRESQNDDGCDKSESNSGIAARKVDAADVPADAMIRLFEEQVNELYTRALMPGLAHLYIGEEAVAVGICEALRPRRLHHQHASRSRALLGERGFAGPDVCGVAGQGSWVLQRQRRLDAHCRSGDGQSGSERDRGRQRGNRHGGGIVRQASGDGASGGVLFWRRRARPGRSV